MNEDRSAEQWLSDLNTIVKLFRAKLADDSAPGGLTYGDAVRKMGALGITEGDARRYLYPKKPAGLRTR